MNPLAAFVLDPVVAVRKLLDKVGANLQLIEGAHGFLEAIIASSTTSSNSSGVAGSE
jgi:hypothetical protein